MGKIIQAVLFDLYNTLVYMRKEDYISAKAQMAESIGASTEVFLALWRQLSLPNSRGDILTVEERVARVMVELEIYPEPNLVRHLAGIELSLQRTGVTVFKDVHATLDRLRKMDFKLGLVTNSGIAGRMVVNNLQLAPLFNTMVFSYEIKSVKPGKLIYKCAMENLRLLPCNCLFVGDGDNAELEGAASLEMKVVRARLLDDPITHQDHTMNASKYPEVSSLLQLPELVENLRKS